MVSAILSNPSMGFAGIVDVATRRPPGCNTALSAACLLN
ncbi:hypothetical protein PXO_01956 [Xanthomonas oryzae pv. oryzae PXO99A]|uniref:Uncharacterized protein n=1 Tax=Xanthomonas oryzae pv. oryzae (strain PXO99A) TaxID=360094 RepID=A0A0K0GN02_XANOP|nr:hypothetical protein PXO_01956 [Xanthomonas oryzae pv. oryzae PXO99A]